MALNDPRLSLRDDMGRPVYPPVAAEYVSVRCVCGGWNCVEHASPGYKVLRYPADGQAPVETEFVNPSSYTISYGVPAPTRGWECPACGVGVAPHVSVCPMCVSRGV